MVQSRMVPITVSSEPLAVPKAVPLLFVLSGPAGVGKDAIADELKRHDPHRHYAITVTTRAPRQGEKDGVHYHFRTMEQFQNYLNDRELVEYAKVYDSYYGVPKFELRDAMQKHQDVVLKVDVQGAATIKQLIPEAVLIFITPYSLSELVHRIFRRGTETREELNRRLAEAEAEIARIPEFDYVVVNKQGELAQAVACVEGIIRAEKSRTQPRVFSLPLS